MEFIEIIVQFFRDFGAFIAFGGTTIWGIVQGHFKSVWNYFISGKFLTHRKTVQEYVKAVKDVRNQQKEIGVAKEETSQPPQTKAPQATPHNLNNPIEESIVEEEFYPDGNIKSKKTTTRKY